MREIRKLEREELVRPRLPTEAAGQGLGPIAVGAVSLCLQGLWKKCAAVTTQEIPEMCGFTW